MSSLTTLTTVPCPSVVDAQLVVTHDCLRLHTQESRGSARMVDVFVLRLTPNGSPSADPLLVLGSDLGDVPDHAGFGPAPNRIHRVVYVMDARGSGFSRPTLACPEADRSVAEARGESRLLQRAVAACRARLESTGIDLTAYGPQAVAADAEALRQALGIKTWNISSYGTSSLYVPAVLAAEGTAVRAVVLDSPYSPDPGSTLAAWDSLVDGCARLPRCAATYPNGEAAALWSIALRRVANSPLVVAANGVVVTVGPTLLGRFVRSMLAGEGPVPPGRLLAALSTITAGKVPLDLAQRIRADGPCLGYRPVCPGRSFSLGAYLAAICAAGPTAPSTPLTSDPRLRFEQADPFAAACARWPTAAAPDGTPVSVPTLQLQGALDPFVATPLPRAGHNHYVVIVPGQTHNVLGYDECPLAIRNAWIDAPTVGPATSCLADMPTIPYRTRSPSY